MGLIALVGIMLAAVGLAGCVFLAHLLLRPLSLSRGLYFVLLLPASIILFAALWFVCNANNLQMQSRMNAVDQDCGWTTYKTGRQVDGLYVEQTGFEQNQDISPAIVQNYSVEYLNFLGLVMRAPAHQYPGQSIGKRTFRYGIRSVRENIPPDIVRTTQTLQDFDTNEVYAKHIEYWFNDKSATSTNLNDLMFLLVKYHPSGCGAMREDEEARRIAEVFPPIASDADMQTAPPIPAPLHSTIDASTPASRAKESPQAIQPPETKASKVEKQNAPVLPPSDRNVQAPDATRQTTAVPSLISPTTSSVAPSSWAEERTKRIRDLTATCTGEIIHMLDDTFVCSHPTRSAAHTANSDTKSSADK